MNLKLSLVALSMLLICKSLLAADPVRIQLIPSAVKSGTVTQFELNLSNKYDLAADPANPAGFTFRLEGKYGNSENSLITSSSKISPASDGNFTAVFSIQDPTQYPDQEIYIKSISPLGEIEQIDFRIVVLEERKLRFNLGLQTSYTHFEDSADTHASQLSLTLRGGATYFFNPSPWLLAATFYFNAVPIITPDHEPAARFWGINTRLGYRLADKILGFAPTLSIGTYFWGMIVPNAAYGIARTYGPQFFISGKRDFADDRYLAVYLKYAPISQSLSQYKFSNHELAIGFATPILNSCPRIGPLILNLDLSKIHVSIPEDDRTVDLRTASLGVSKEF